MGVALKRRPRRVKVRGSALAIPAHTESRIRRGVDLLGAGIAILLLSPFLLLGMIAVAFSGRPIFFGHNRIGRNGTPFRCWKLRTMRIDAEHQLDIQPGLYEQYVRNGYKLPVDCDPRVTRAGSWLRRTYIDEIPQLFNVVGGSMSLFGPRPVVERELTNYGRYARHLLTVKPGLLGAWTSLGRARPPYPERARLEVDYVVNRNAFTDLRILLRAIPVVFRGQSA